MLDATLDRISVDPKDGTVSCKCRAYSLVSTCCHVEEYIKARHADDYGPNLGDVGDLEPVTTDDADRDAAIARRNQIGRVYGFTGRYGCTKGGA